MKLVESSKIFNEAESLFKKWEKLIIVQIPIATFEHIGSTAIKGAVTKGDIDFYLEVDPADHENAVDKLIQLGFKVAVDTHRDADLCMMQNDECAIQIVSKGSKYEFFKKFRDKLNSAPFLVEKYNQLKLASIDATIDEYRSKKSSFIRSVLQKL